MKYEIMRSHEASESQWHCIDLEEINKNKSFFDVLLHHCAANR